MNVTHQIRLRPGQSIAVRLVEELDNGYPDELGLITITWQKRDAPTGEVATKGRELLVEFVRDPRVGPLIVRHP